METLVLILSAVGQYERQLLSLQQRQEFAIHHHKTCFGMTDDIRDLGCGEAPIQRGTNSADAVGRVYQQRTLRAVAREARHTIAARNAKR